MPSTDRWAVRIDRARTLAARHAPAADILRFYTQLAAHQQTLATRWDGSPWDSLVTLAALPDTLAWLERRAPPALSGTVATLRDEPREAWQRRLERYLTADDLSAADAPAMFVIETLLQPLAERCATVHSMPPGHGNRCPFCRQRPVAGVLRDAGQGTRRALVCGLCFTEWGFERIVCPSCGERQFDALPVYTAEQIAGARVDGCDSCGVYLKTLDASADGSVVPEVDDIATLTLDLWAREHGYRRLRSSFYL